MSARFINPLQVLNIKGVVSPVRDEIAPLRLTAVGGIATVGFNPYNAQSPVSIWYRLPNGNWQAWDFGSLNIQDGEYIEFYGKYVTGGEPIGTFLMSGANIEASGSIMTMCYGKSVTQEENIGSLPADRIFESLFENCTTLTTSPDLPSRQPGARYGYKKMFSGCSNLTAVSVGMYNWWDYSSVQCTIDWMQGVSPTGIFHCPLVLNQSQRDDSHIPAGWTVETF